MALGARIRRAQRNRQVGAWNPDAVIAPRIDDHEIFGWHVTVDALCAGAAWLVVMVLGYIKFCRQVALTAQRISVGTQLRAVRVVAVRAGDARVKHAALQERAVFVDLAVDLPVGVIEARLEQRRQIGVEEGLARHRVLGDDLAAGMARGAGIDLGRSQLLGAPGNPGLRVHLPMTVIGRLQPIGQAHPVRIVSWLSLLARLGPGDVAGTGAVARLAGNVDIGPARRVGIGGEVVVLLQIGRVAIGALVIPGLVAPGPVQRVAGFEFLIGVEMEPALAALVFRPAVPGDPERLQPSARHRDQVLLQRIDPERVGDWIFMQSAVGAVGADHELVAVAEEGGCDPEMLQLRASEITKHGCRGGGLHRQRVVRTLPGLRLG